MSHRKGWTIIELMMVMSIILVLLAFLLPVLTNATDRARYVKWASYSHTLKADPTLALYHSFEEQTGEEVYPDGSLRVRNEATGDPMLQARGIQDPFNGDGLGNMPTTHPNNGLISGGFTHRYARWPGKGGILFNGLDQKIAMRERYTANSVGEVTVAAWVRSNSTQNQFIASTDRSVCWRLALRDDGGANHAAFDTSAVGASTVTDDLRTNIKATDLIDDQWHLIVGTYSVRSNVKRIYYDGQLDKSVSNPHDGLALGGGGGVAERYGFIGVGSESPTFNGTTGPDEWLMGILDEFMIFNRALDKEEVRAMFSAGVPTRTY